MKHTLIPLVLALSLTPFLSAQNYYENDFESDTVGEVPAGDMITFSPSTNTTENGAVVVDATSTPANPLSGKSLYIYDLGSSPTHMRFPFNGGVNVSNLRVDVDFQRSSVPDGLDDENIRVQLAVGRAGDALNNSDFRPFEVRLQNRGKIQVNSIDGTVTAADYLTDAPNHLTLLINSHDTDSVAVNDATLGMVTVQPNTMQLFLNDSFVGAYTFHQTPDPANAPQIDFYAENNDLGQFALYQDSSRTGGIVFDNLKLAGLVSEPPPPVTDKYFEADFDTDTVGEQPSGGYTFSPSGNTGNNGAVVIDATSTPANPLGGQSLLIYDYLGDLSNGDPTHMRKPFNGENVSNLRVDFDFQRGSLETDATDPLDTDTRVHFAVGRIGDSLNNSDFRPFEIRIANNGTVVVNSIAGSTAGDAYLLDAPNHLTLLINSHDTNSVDYDDPTLGTGTVLPNNLQVFLNDSSIGTYVFFQTPDPVNAPQVDFYAQDNDLGQFAFYQDSKRQGDLVVDNLVIESLLASVTTLPAPTDLAATAESAVAVSLGWTDNATDETAYVVERKTGDGEYSVIAELAADVEGYLDETVLPETTYTYRVKAATATVESEYSNESEVTTPEQVEPLIVGQNVPNLVVSGDDAMVTITSLGRAPLSYKWYTGVSGDTSTPIAGAESATLSLEGMTATTQVWVEVTNTEGSANSETITVKVRAPVNSVVTSESELNAAIAAAGPGDTILMAAGTWEDLVIRLVGEGTEAHPITLGVETPGSVILTGASRAEIGGTWLVLRDLSFEGAYTGNDDEIVQFRQGSGNLANHCRVTNISIVDYIPANGDRTFWISFYGTYNRLDHSYLSGHNVSGVTAVVWLDGSPNHHRIDHNQFANRIFGGENGWETIRIGTSEYSMSSSQTTVDHNLFTRVDGEIEIISNKSGDNIYRYNSFVESQGTLTLRHGNRCIVDSNTFYGGGREGTGGIRVIGTDHLIINNHFEATTARDGAAITVYSGVSGGPLDGYFAADRATIAFNTFVDNVGLAIDVGTGLGTSDRTVLPTGIRVFNNLLTRTSASTAAFVGGENPEDQAWTKNMIHNGTAGIDSVDGFVTADPLLSWNALRQLVLPASDGPVASAAARGILTVALDIDGKARGSVQDIGAHEVSSDEILASVGPVSAVDTGPSFLGPKRVPGEPNARLVNNSTRAISNTGEALLINGFVVAGADPKSVLIRAVGPGLSAYSVTDPMPEPVLRLFDASGSIVESNTGWQTGPERDLAEAAAVVGAFALEDGSLDSALLTTLWPGAYTAQVTPAEGTVGTVLLEIYDLTEAASVMTNQSSRGEVGVGQEVLITGFVIGGADSRQVLVRGAGPALTGFGVTTAIGNPTLEIIDADDVSVAANDDWSDSAEAAAIEAAAEVVGAFPFASGSQDAAILITLPPGVYTARVKGVSGDTGTTLVEIYLLD
ncbi:MAG: chondroitinase-B domain-containing protein [Opitutaceae bacterium]